MISESEIYAALGKVVDPELGKDIISLNMVRDLQVSPAGVVCFTFALTVINCPMRDQMAKQARETLLALPGVQSVEITYAAMTPEERQDVIGKAAPALPKLNTLNKIGRVLSVMSGKGGVGKSSVTAMLAVELARRGQKVGILDADITGPSIPKLFGLPPGGLRGSVQGILPAITPLGIRIVSSNLLLPEEDSAVIWRGPMISGTIRQFWENTLWGRLDTLLVDLPPGTSDAAITVMQSLPVEGVVLVTTPQQLAALVVRKAVHMLEKLNIPILGIVENMSYFRSPDDGKIYEVFGPSHAAEIAQSTQVPIWTRLPVDPQIVAWCDSGQVEKATLPEMAALAEKLSQPQDAVER